VGGNPLRFIDPYGLTAACPSSPPINNPSWVPYGGDSSVYHCNYDGYLENRIPDKRDPSPTAECFYDEEDNICDENHEYPGCRGTPDEYPVAAGDGWNPTNWPNIYNHLVNDEGGPSGPSTNPAYDNLGEEAAADTRRHYEDNHPLVCRRSGRSTVCSRE